MRFNRVFGIFLAVTIITFAMIAPIHAQETDLFTIKDVKVDVTAANAVTAKNRAVEKGRNQAFATLLNRLLSASEVEYFEQTDPQTVSSLVQDFEIISEQLASDQYIGVFTFRFNESAVRRYLKGTGASFSDVKRDPILMLPYYQSGGRYVMFEDSNPWLTAWQRQDTFKGLVPILVPLGDIQDISDIGQSHPLQYDEAALTRLAQRYNVKDILITIASVEPETNDVRIYVYRTDGVGVRYAETIRSGSALSEGYDEGVKKIHRFLAEDWKQKTALSANAAIQYIDVFTSFRSLKEWAQRKKALENISSIEEVELVSLSPSRADLRLKYQGEYDRLNRALGQAGLKIDYPNGQGSQYKANLRPIGRRY